MTTSRSSPLVSLVTPFHNTAAHLGQCIESVLGQTYAPIEYILQDNASDDGSTQIALEYARRDSRVRYFRLDELLPQVPNYNLALSRIGAASKYVKIAQADDWLMTDCVRRMVEVGEASPRVGLISSYRLQGDHVAGEGLRHDMTAVSGREVARLHLLEPHFLFGSPTTVMYRSDAVRQRKPFFATNRLAEDTEACYEILRTWDFGYVHQILSYTRIEQNSTIGSVRGMDPFILGRLMHLRRYGPEFLDATEYRIRLEEVERRYYRHLARAKFLFREPAYWGFHRRWLATDGLGIEPAKLARQMGRELASVIGCPQQILSYVRSWRHKTPLDGY